MTYEERLRKLDLYKEQEKTAMFYVRGFAIVVIVVCIILLQGCSCDNGADIFRSCGEYQKQDCNQAGVICAE